MGANLMSLARSGDQFLKLYGDRKIVRTLPYDAEVEWLNFNRECSIVIDYTPQIFTSWFSIDVQSSGVFMTGGSTIILHALNTENGQYFSANFEARQHQGGQVFNWFGKVYDGVRTWILDADYSARSEFNWRYNEASFNGKSVQTQGFTTDFLIPNDGISIFHGPFIAYAAIVYGIKFGFGSETTYDMIPVRFTNESGGSEGAMYDRVSGQLFRNQGTGAFIIGPDKTI